MDLLTEGNQRMQHAAASYGTPLAILILDWPCVLTGIFYEKGKKTESTLRASTHHSPASSCTCGGFGTVDVEGGGRPSAAASISGSGSPGTAS